MSTLPPPVEIDPCPFCGASKNDREPITPAPTFDLQRFDEPVSVPVAFFIGLGVGLLLAFLAVMVGFMLSMS